MNAKLFLIILIDMLCLRLAYMVNQQNPVEMRGLGFIGLIVIIENVWVFRERRKMKQSQKKTP